MSWRLCCDLTAKRALSSSASIWAKKMPNRPPLVNEEEFTESFLKGSGPGGQKIVSCHSGSTQEETTCG